MAKVRQVVKIRKKKGTGTKVCKTCNGTGRVKA